jgi:leucyl/phenylalanyl-tRNA--protein transferase
MVGELLSDGTQRRLQISVEEMVQQLPLSTEILLTAYCQGLFPMAHGDGGIYWYDPDPRAILPLGDFHVPRSLKRTVRKRNYVVRIDAAFERVIKACSTTGPDRPETWISEEIIVAYVRLHEQGFAHSVEIWSEEDLVGGLYGVAIRGLFAGESMFSRQTDASKIALVQLVNRLREKGFRLLDVQFMTDHLRRFGAIEIPRNEYRVRLAEALAVHASF